MDADSELAKGFPRWLWPIIVVVFWATSVVDGYTSLVGALGSPFFGVVLAFVAFFLLYRSFRVTVGRRERYVAFVAGIITSVLALWRLWQLFLSSSATAAGAPALPEWALPTALAVSGVAIAAFTAWDLWPANSSRILVCELSEGAGNGIPSDRGVTERLFQSLRRETQGKHVRVENLKLVVLREEEARRLGNDSKALAVLYGFYTRNDQYLQLDLGFEVIRPPAVYHPVKIRRNTVPIDELNGGRFQFALETDVSGLVAFLLGLVAYSKHEYQQARAYFVQVRDLLEHAEFSSYQLALSLSDVLLYLGNTLFNLDLQQESQDAFSRALELNPRAAKALHNLGVLAFNRGDLGSARDYFDKALHVDPALTIAVRNRGVVHFELRETDLALHDLERYCREVRHDVQARYVMACCLERSAKLVEALDECEHLMVAEGDHVEVWILAARLCLRLNRTRDVERALKRIGKLAPGDLGPQLVALGELAHEGGQPETAIAYLGRSGKGLIRAAQFLRRGEAYKEMGRVDEAVADFEAAIHCARKEDDRRIEAAAWFRLGNARLHGKQIPSAIEAYGHALAIEDSCSVRGNRGQAFLSVFDWPNAVADFTYCVEHAPPHQRLKWLRNRSVAKAKLDDYAGAIADMTVVYEMDPSDNHRFDLARLKYSGAKTWITDPAMKLTAVQHLRSALKLDPTLAGRASEYPQFMVHISSE